MGKVAFKLFAENRVSFSSATWSLIIDGTVKIRNGPRV